MAASSDEEAAIVAVVACECCCCVHVVVDIELVSYFSIDKIIKHDWYQLLKFFQ